MPEIPPSGIVSFDFPVMILLHIHYIVYLLISFNRMALQVVPLLQQWLLLYQFIVQQQIAAYRTSAKLLSILLAVLGDVTAKVRCLFH